MADHLGLTWKELPACQNCSVEMCAHHKFPPILLANVYINPGCFADENASWYCFQGFLGKVDNTDVNNASSPASVITTGLTPLFLAHPDLWQLSVFDKITVCLINAQKLADTWKQREFCIISPVVILPPACPLMGLHWKSSRLTALGLINPVMGVIKMGLGNLSSSQSLPAGL